MTATQEVILAASTGTVEDIAHHIYLKLCERLPDVPPRSDAWMVQADLLTNAVVAAKGWYPHNRRVAQIMTLLKQAR